jgi:VIT1/CCC1 family predicted Fe2+/Mn2+ transporter
VPHFEKHRSGVGGWLRAAVLGANDGVVSTASLVLGVAAANASASATLTAGLAGLVGGALSMAAGEYVSVSSQRDVERADLAVERRELERQPELELVELTAIYVAKGLDEALARKVAETLTAKGDVLAIHAKEELGIDPDALARPVQAAVSSAIAFASGAALPLLAMTLTPELARIPVTLGAALVTLGGLGAWSAKLGGAPIGRAVVRVLVGGALAMGLTMAIGALFGVSA